MFRRRDAASDKVRTVGLGHEALLQGGLDRLSAFEQMGFIEDQWVLVRNGTLGAQRFLPVLERFSTAKDHNVVRAVTDRLGTLELLLEARLGEGAGDLGSTRRSQGSPRARAGALARISHLG